MGYIKTSGQSQHYNQTVSRHVPHLVNDRLDLKRGCSWMILVLEEERSVVG